MKNRIFLAILLSLMSLQSWAQIGGDYNPENPSDPQVQARQFQFSVVAEPEKTGSFNIDDLKVEAGREFSLIAYNAKSDYVFKHWMLGDSILSTDDNLTFVMPSHNVQLIGVFEYNPASPANPGSNHWDSKIGEVIVDDFKPGDLYNAIYYALNGSSSQDVTMITVAGKMSSGDFGIANSYSNCTLLDLSRVTGITEVPFYAFDRTNLESVYLPATIEKIDGYAFYNCPNLVSLTIYAMTPPELGSNVFAGVPEDLTIYIPAAAIAQYQEDETWGKFTLLPIQEDIRSISVSLPAGANAQDYAQMWLELTNTKSGQRMHYIMTDRQKYSFANIIRNTSWNVTLRNEHGDVFGQIDNVEVQDEDVEVAFSSLSKPQNISLSVIAPDGTDVTTKAQITWMDAKGNYLAQTTGLSAQPAGNTVSYKVTLAQELAMQYATPMPADHVVADGKNDVQVKLEPIKQVTLSGNVKDLATKTALNGAVVTASQTFAGKYSKTVSTKTDANGNYTLMVSNVPTSLAVSASDYISQTIVCDSLMTGSETITLSDVSLKGISGAVISLSLSYTQCPTEDSVEGAVQDWYADYNNVSYSIYNRTKQVAISQFNVQYPQIVLLEEVEEGDVLEMTATSKTGTFMPVKAIATIDAEQNGTAAFSIVELGKIKASFAHNSNPSVVGTLYDANGKLIKSYDYSGGSLTINDLVDGRYTLVSMGNSRLFSSIYDLSQLPQTGLVAGSDYTQASVMVSSGKLAVIDIDEVPALDESKLYYTGDNTSFTVNKSSIVAGNYLTLTGHIDFKSAYSANVSNVNLIVDLPESCQFVENSVMVGNSTSSYTLQNNRIIIPLARYTDRVRFCIIPTLGGDYAPSALAQFDLEGKTITQPIGSANYTAKDLSISVPSTVAKTAIPVSGTAIGASTIEIYDNNVLIGQTNSLANGSWATTCELNDPYNLSNHQIYAKATTKQGLELFSEKKELLYDLNAIQVSKVKMFHDNPEMHKTYEIVFDFLNPTSEDQFYIYYIYNKVFTFTIDFTSNDTTKISDVVLNVITGNGNEKSLNANYDKTKGYWVASGDFGNMYDGDIPVNVSVDYYCESIPMVDRKQINNELASLESAVTSNIEERKLVNDELSLVNKDDDNFTIIDALLNEDSLNVEALITAYDAILSNNQVDSFTKNESDLDLLEKKFDSMYKKWEEQYNSCEKDSLLDFIFDNEEISYNINRTFKNQVSSTTYSISSISVEEISQLSDSGYEYYDITDSSKVYYKYSEDSMVFIDVAQQKKFIISTVNEDITAKANIRTLNDDSMKGIDECARSIGTTIINIKKLLDNGKLELKEAIEQLHSLYGFAQCYYTAILSNINYSLVANVNKTINDYDDKIKAGEELRDLSESRVLSIREKLLENDRLKKQVDAAIAKNQDVLLHGNLSESEFKALSAQSEALKNQSQIYGAEIEAYKGALKSENSKFAKYKNEVENLVKGRKGALEAKGKINSLLAKLPKAMVPGAKAAKVMSVGGRIAGIFGEVLRVWSFGVDVIDAARELQEWAELEDAIEKKLPCEKDHDRAISLQQEIHSSAAAVLAHYIAILSAEVSAISLDLAGGVPGISPTWWAASLCDIYAEWAKYLQIEKYIGIRGEYWLDIMYLQCSGNEPKDPRTKKDPSKDKHKNKRHEDSKNKNSGKGIDPSGFVYEGVFSNRLEGVTATVYYKEMVEDMYGDLHENIVKWDAAEYAQENPLFTDENGYYRWDVPQGLWQVKFEKEGYETTYSEWLPVPPPQLDVNIAMKQNRQPEVKNARAYEDAVEVEFDKYMMPELLNTDNIIVMAGDKQVEGSIKLLNEEIKAEGETESFASKLRFNAKAPFEGTEITLMINNQVKSYAGIRMQDNFSQAFTIEQEIKQIESDSLFVVGYGDEVKLNVSLLPGAASKGKTLNVKTSSSLILGVETEQVIVDDKGNAEITLTGNLPGTAALTFSVEGTDKTATTIVNVKVLGDINGDGVINEEDLAILVDYLLAKEVTDYLYPNLDVNQDGDVTVSDLVSLIRILAKKTS